MEPTREIYWNISGYYFLYGLLVISAVIFVLGLYKRMQTWRAGTDDNRLDAIALRLMGTVKQVFLHNRLVRYPLAGVFHALLFGGFVILFMGTVVVLIEADFGLHVMRGNFYLYFQSLFLDIAGFAAMVGVIIAGVNRYLVRPNRYDGRPAGPIILVSLLVILVSGFLIEGARISITNDPWGNWSPVGLWTAGIFNSTSIEVQSILHRLLWWFHLSAVLALFAYLPYSKLIHVMFGPANIFLRSTAPKGVTVHPIDLETAEKLGAQALSDFSWKQLFDLDACTECGRCQDNCPVSLAGKSFSPREIILNLRSQLRNTAPATGEQAENPVPIIGEAIDEEWLWMCRTCRACMEECPVFIEVVPKLVELRRFQVMEEAAYPKSLQDSIECLESRMHPYRGTLLSRMDWCKDLDITVVDETSPVDYLYWVGCTTALNEDNMSIARSLAKLLTDAGVSFGIIGEGEICCGEPARRIGNEYLFENIVRQNIETFNKLKFKKIITNCPHCYNVLKLEYPQFGSDYTVLHHSELLAELIAEGKIDSGARMNGDTIAYHDPCYLGRYNDNYDKPRAVISSMKDVTLTEMPRTKDRSYCCGGGGGGAWLSEEGAPVEERVNVCRGKQVLESGASVLATSCPYCKMMMKDGITTADSEAPVRVLDIAELLSRDTDTPVV